MDRTERSADGPGNLVVPEAHQQYVYSRRPVLAEGELR